MKSYACLIYGLCVLNWLCLARLVNGQVTIDFTSFPNGDPIPNETQITDQFQTLGVTFTSGYISGPHVQNALDGILISGGPTGFFGTTEMDFSVPVNTVTLGIIGSGLYIGGQMTAYDTDGNLLGQVHHFYGGATGQESFFSINTGDQYISRLFYDAGLNPNAAASIGEMSFSFAPPAPPPEPSTVPDSGTTIVLLLLSAVAVVAFSRTTAEYPVRRTVADHCRSAGLGHKGPGAPAPQPDLRDAG